MEWNRGDFSTVWPLAIFTLSFIAYHFLSASEGIRHKLTSRYAARKAEIRRVLIQRGWGVLWLGIIPLVAAWWLPAHLPSDLGVGAGPLLPSLYWIFGAAAVIIPMNLIAARKPGALSQYPQYRIHEWDRQTIIGNILSWLAYLLAYEFIFRGFLFFPLISSWGIWPAIAVNTALYACVHIPKGAREAFGAIPLGVFVCVATVSTGMIWAAFWIHATLALSNFLVGLPAHPEMRIVKGRANPDSGILNPIS
jgi:membrane protease YdiL (CAAX protease family)